MVNPILVERACWVWECSDCGKSYPEWEKDMAVNCCMTIDEFKSAEDEKEDG